MDDLYPPGHPPCLFSGDAAQYIQEIASEPSRAVCLRAAALDAWMIAWHLEILRARLYRGEQLHATEPVPAEDEPGRLDQARDLPQRIGLALQVIDATRACLEWWWESSTYQEILATHPRQAAADGD